MKREVKKRLLIYGTAAIFMGLVGAAWWHHHRVERAYANAFLLNALSEVSLAETSLRLMDENRTDTARQLLAMRLSSAVDTAEELSTYGAHPGPLAWANLRESLRRASERAHREGREDFVRRIDTLASTLEKRDLAGSAWFDGWF